MVLLGYAMRICVCFEVACPCVSSTGWSIVRCNINYVSACRLLEISVRCILLYLLHFVISALSQEFFFSSEALYIE